MASTYSTNLALELIGTGDQAGTWGTTTNTNLGTLIEQAISGYVTQAVSTGTDTTITIPNGSTGVARNMYIELTGTGGTNTNLIVPANKKLYFIFNNTASGQVTVKVSGQTGVSVPNKAKMILVSNGTDIVDATNYVGNLSAASATITNLSSSSATITNLIATTASVSDLSATVSRSASATITNLIATTASVSNLSATVSRSASATITNLIATTGTVTTLSATSGSITNLVSSDASATVLRSASGTITNLLATTATITDLRAPTASATVLRAASATITNLLATSATVSSGSTLNGGVVVNEPGADVDFCIEGDTDANLFFVDASTDRIGIGTSSPDAKLSVNGVASFGAGTASLPSVAAFGDLDTGMWFPAANTVAWSTGGGERMRLVSDSGNAQLLLGSTSALASSSGVKSSFQSVVAPAIHAMLYGQGIGNVSNGTQIVFTKTRAASAGDYSVALQSGDGIGFIPFEGSDGVSSLRRAAAIDVSAGGNFSPTSSPGILRFFTTPSGSVTTAERLRIDSAGNVGIGTTSPNERLEVAGNIHVSGADRTIYNRSNNFLAFGTNNTERARITAGGEVYIAGTTDQGAYNLQVNGTGVWGAGAYVNGSDERLKDNIQSLDSGLDVVKAMRPVTFQYKPEHSSDQSVQPGFIAQELQQAMAGKPYLDGVVQAGPEYLNVAYQNIIPILVKAIQELEAKVAALEAK